MEETNKFDMMVLPDDEGGERMASKMKEILADIEAYKEAVENLEGAIAEAERELIEELQRREEASGNDDDPFKGDREMASCHDDSVEDYPEYNKD